MRSLVLLAALLLPACTSGPSSLRIESARGVVEPDLRTAVYRFRDANTADLYLSDLPPDILIDRLASRAAGEPGTLVHCHIFLNPKAGRTPIDYTASNCTLTCAIFTGSSLGVYGGGGFLLPADSLGDATLAGTIRDATLRLVEHDPGFADRLGSARLAGRIAAERDDQLADAISARLTRLLLP
jgi:hypothetical protein